MKTPIYVRLKEIRTEQNLTQSQFGKLLNVSQDTVSLWEKGKSAPNAEQIIRIAELFQLSCDYILGLKEY